MNKTIIGLVIILIIFLLFIFLQNKQIRESESVFTFRLNTCNSEKKILIKTHENENKLLTSKINSCEMDNGALTAKYEILTSKINKYESVNEHNINQVAQITMETNFGKELNKLAKQEDVNLFLEIGTLYGTGSSLCIAQGLHDSLNKQNKMLYTIEIYEPAWLNARKLLNGYPVRCILGGTVPKKNYLTQKEIDQNELSYYERDLKLIDIYEPMLKPLCENHKFDAVFMDGNVYTSWAEFLIVKDICKPKYLAFNRDKKIETWLKENNKEWKELTIGIYKKII